MTSGHKGPNRHPPSTVTQRPIFLWQWSDSTSVGLIGDAHVADARRVSEQIVCSECGSASLISSGVFEHGTWIHRLTCWSVATAGPSSPFPDRRRRSATPKVPAPHRLQVEGR